MVGTPFINACKSDRDGYAVRYLLAAVDDEEVVHLRFLQLGRRV
jgi:hypothetical protein